MKRNNEYQKLQRALYDEQTKIQKTYERTIATLSDRFTPTALDLTTDVLANNISHNVSSSDANIEEYDVFISHAWEDKQDFVDELVKDMENIGIRIWYDTKKLQWGDSMRSKIDEGLRKSKFGIAILSPNYISEGKYWTKEELNGLFQLESVNGKKFFLSGTI